VQEAVPNWDGGFSLKARNEFKKELLCLTVVCWDWQRFPRLGPMHPVWAAGVHGRAEYDEDKEGPEGWNFWPKTLHFPGLARLRVIQPALVRWWA
jgi:hypothetical protein